MTMQPPPAPVPAVAPLPRAFCFSFLSLAFRFWIPRGILDVVGALWLNIAAEGPVGSGVALAGRLWL